MLASMKTYYSALVSLTQQTIKEVVQYQLEDVTSSMSVITMKTHHRVRPPPLTFDKPNQRLSL